MLSALAAAREAPERAALVFSDRELTWGELGALVAARAPALARAPGGCAELVADARLETLVDLLACFELGVPVQLLHPRWTERERDEARASAVDATIAPGTAVVVFTSGTTGRPRGALLSHRALELAAAASAANLGWYEDDRWLLGLPLAHVGGLSVLTRCLLARRTVVVPAPSTGGAHDLEALLRSVERERVTLLSLVPTQLRRVVTSGWRPSPSLRAVLVGGAALPAPLADAARARGLPVVATYGLTETCSQLATQRYETRFEGGPLRALCGVELRVDDGVLAARTPFCFSGYLGDARPACDAEGWLVTGDAATLDDHGALHLLGRRSDLIVSGGENVYPAEVERVTLGFEGVADACVFGVDDPEWGALVALAVVPHGEIDAAALAAYLARELAPFKRPRRWTTTSALATLPSGKVDRRAVAQSLRDRLSALTVPTLPLTGRP